MELFSTGPSLVMDQITPLKSFFQDIQCYQSQVAQINYLLGCLTLKTKTLCSFKASVTIYPYTS